MKEALSRGNIINPVYLVCPRDRGRREKGSEIVRVEGRVKNFLSIYPFIFFSLIKSNHFPSIIIHDCFCLN